MRDLFSAKEILLARWLQRRETNARICVSSIKALPVPTPGARHVMER